MNLTNKGNNYMYLEKAQVKKVEEYLEKNNTNRISAKEFNRILSTTINEKPSEVNNKNYSLRDKYNFNFKFLVEKIDQNTFKFILIGKHISTNTFNGYAAMGKRSAYKRAIKSAAYTYSLLNKKVLCEILPLEPFQKATLEPIAYNPKSRDDDGCSVTLKTLRDLLTTYKFIKDDNRKCITQLPVKEVISKEYKIELVLRKIT